MDRKTRLIPFLLVDTLLFVLGCGPTSEEDSPSGKGGGNDSLAGDASCWVQTKGELELGFPCVARIQLDEDDETKGSLWVANASREEPAFNFRMGGLLSPFVGSYSSEGLGKADDLSASAQFGSSRDPIVSRVWSMQLREPELVLIPNHGSFALTFAETRRKLFHEYELDAVNGMLELKLTPLEESGAEKEISIIVEF